MTVSLIGYSLPSFFIGLVLVFIIILKLGWLPFPAYVSPFENPVQFLQTMILPWIVLASLNAAFYMRLTRNQVLETFGEDYVRTARAKGLPQRTVVVKHALRAGLTPIVTAAGLDLAYLLGGAIISENIFSLPGLGSLAIRSVLDSDLPVITGITLVDGDVDHRREPGGRPAVRGGRPTREDCLMTTADSAERPFLSVSDLAVAFPTEDGLVRAVDGVSFSVERGETLAIVGESGSGKSVTAQAIMGLLNRSSSQISGEIWLDGEELVGMPEADVQALRGSQMAMIFQDPMSSLHPFYRIGDQIMEAIAAHRSIGKAEARRETIDMLRTRRDPGRRAARRRLSAPAVRRHAPARDDRDGADQLARAPDRGRADDGA